MLDIAECYFGSLVLDADARAWGYGGTTVTAYSWMLQLATVKHPCHNKANTLNGIDTDQPSRRDLTIHREKIKYLTREL